MGLGDLFGEAAEDFEVESQLWGLEVKAITVGEVGGCVWTEW